MANEQEKQPEQEKQSEKKWSLQILGFLKDYWILISAGYFYITLTGMIYSALLFHNFGINFFDYAEIDDLFFSALRNTSTIILFVVILVLLWGFSKLALIAYKLLKILSEKELFTPKLTLLEEWSARLKFFKKLFAEEWSQIKTLAKVAKQEREDSLLLLKVWAQESSHTFQVLSEVLQQEIDNSLRTFKSWEWPDAIKNLLKSLKQEILNNLRSFQSIKVPQEHSKKLNWFFKIISNYLLQVFLYLQWGVVYVLWGVLYIFWRVLHLIGGMIYIVWILYVSMVFYTVWGILYTVWGVLYIVWKIFYLVWGILFYAMGKVLYLGGVFFLTVTLFFRSLFQLIVALCKDLGIGLGLLVTNFVLISSFLYIVLIIALYFGGLSFLAESVAKGVKGKQENVQQTSTVIYPGEVDLAEKNKSLIKEIVEPVVKGANAIINYFSNPQETYIQFNALGKTMIGNGTDGGDFTLIGRAGNFIFAYDKCKKIPLGIPTSAILQILVKNEDNQESFENIPHPVKPPPENEELSKLQQEIKDIEAELKELKTGGHQKKLQKQIEDIEAELEKLKTGDHRIIKDSIQQLLKRWGIPNAKPVATVYFCHNQDTLQDDTKEELENWIFANDSLRHLALMGYADTTGASGYNWGLSLRRALHVRENFKEQGIHIGIISVDGLGEEGAPVKSEDEQSEPENRVVEIYQLGGETLKTGEKFGANKCSSKVL